MAIEITDRINSIQTLLDFLLQRSADLRQSQVEISATHGTFSGELISRTPEFVHLRDASSNRWSVMEGPREGMQVEINHVIRLGAIQAVSFAQYVPKPEAEKTAAAAPTRRQPKSKTRAR